MRAAIHGPAVLLFSSFALLGGCGGGSGGGGTLSPPPSLQPDFSVSVSATSLSLTQGDSSSPVAVSINGINGFTGTVQIAVSGAPAGLTSAPSLPLSIAAGQSASVVFAAAPGTPTGQFTLSAQASSGSISHSATFSVSINAAVTTSLPRSTFIRNDTVALVDTPPGEPRRHQVVFDPSGARWFVANPAMNRVEVYPDAFPARAGAIDAPAASSVDLSADGSTLWVGTNTEQLLAVSTATLQVQSRFPIAGLSPIPGVVFNRPKEALSLSSGKIALRLRQASASESLLTVWDPATNTAADLTPLAPAVFQNGLGVMARSGDRTRLLAASNDATGQVVLINASASVAAGPQSIGAGAIAALAGNSDGSRFAAILNGSSAQSVVLLSAQLGVLASYASTNATGIVFSRDSQTLYVSEAFANGRVVTALTASSLQKIGQASDLAVQGVPTAIEDADASQMVLGRGNRGVAFLDVASLTTLPAPAPALAPVPAALPAEGPNTGGTTITVFGSSFPAGAQIRFGTQSPLAASVLGSTQLQVASPPSGFAGPANLTVYFSNGWLAVAPEGFSYGPSVEEVFPNAGSSSGNDTVYLIGHGFGADPNGLSVQIGGQAAAVQKIEALPAFASALGLDATYPFPLERITIATPSATAGKADISLTSSAGGATSPNSFQFLAARQIYANPGLYKFILYDQSRQRLYLSATDHVDVFDLSNGVFRTPIEPPPNGPPPTAGLRGMALTPDNSQLVVADFGSQLLYLINPDGAAYNGSRVSVGGVAGFLNSGPSRVAATSAQTVFVGLSGEGGTSNACSSCLGQMNLTAFPATYEPAPQPQVNSITGAPLLQSDGAGDSVYLAFGTSPGGPFASWSASAPNSFDVSTAKNVSTDLAAAAGGAMFAIRANNADEIRSANLTLVASPTSTELEAIPNRVAVPGLALHPSGGLLYEPFLSGPPPAAPPARGIQGGVDIRDAHTGRLRLRVALPEPLAMLDTDVDGLHGVFLATDENGQRLFALTTSGLTVVQLANVPLGIGSLSPAAGPAPGGTVATISGSGFQSAIKATLGGQPANVTFKDANTLTITTPALLPGPQQLILTNPDGESISLDAAYLAH